MEPLWPHFIRYGSNNLESDSEWHMLSKVTVEEDEGERDESAEIKVTLDPEKASNLITSQSSNNKWVDGYLKEDRFRPPFGFKPAKQKLKLSHLSGGNYLFPVELEMPNIVY